MRYNLRLCFPLVKSVTLEMAAETTGSVKAGCGQEEPVSFKNRIMKTNRRISSPPFPSATLSTVHDFQFHDSWQQEGKLSYAIQVKKTQSIRCPITHG